MGRLIGQGEVKTQEDKVNCVGRLIGQGEVKTQGDKVNCIRNAPIPTTKKQVRSFLGLAAITVSL